MEHASYGRARGKSRRNRRRTDGARSDCAPRLPQSGAMLGLPGSCQSIHNLPANPRRPSLCTPRAPGSTPPAPPDQPESAADERLDAPAPAADAGATESRSPSPAPSDPGARVAQGVAGATSTPTRPRCARTDPPRSLTLPGQPRHLTGATPAPPHRSFRHPQAKRPVEEGQNREKQAPDAHPPTLRPRFDGLLQLCEQRVASAHSRADFLGPTRSTPVRSA
jgi:hypothetical protein